MPAYFAPGLKTYTVIHTVTHTMTDTDTGTHKHTLYFSNLPVWVVR